MVMIFFYMIPKHKQQNFKNKQFGLHQAKNLWIAKETLKMKI